MRFSTISAVLAFAASALAQTANFDPITKPTQDQNVAAGSTLDIVWEPSANHTGTITITLLQGATPATLTLGDVIKAGIDNSVGKYSWAIPSTIAPFPTYGFKLTLDSDTTIFQYSFPFHITGTSAGSYSASGTSPASTKTMTLSTATGYTTSSISTSSANITSVVKTASANSTLSTVTSAKPTGNTTLSFVPTTTGSGNSASKTASTTSTGSPSAATTNAAMANIASGSMALVGGLVLAFAM